MSRKPKQLESDKIAIFEGEEIRKVFFDGEWYFALEDIVETLTDSSNVKEYIKKLGSSLE